MTPDDLRNLRDRLKEKEKDQDTIRDLRTQLEAIHFHPLLFKSLCKKFQVPDLLDLPLDRLALQMNKKDDLSKIIIQWRFDRAVE